MESIAIYTPWTPYRPGDDAATEPAPRRPSDWTLPQLRMRVELAAEHVRTLERAADIQRAIGSWAPNAALNYRDYRALADAQDAARGHRR